MASRLYRSSNNKVIAGVCGGLGEYFDIDPTLLRLIAVVAAIAGFGTPVLAYLLGWIIIPQRFPGDVASEPVAPEHSEHRASDSKMRSYLPGLILVALGAIFLAREYFYWFSFGDMWPIVLVAVGLILIFRNKNSAPDNGSPNNQSQDIPPNRNSEGGPNQ